MPQKSLTYLGVAIILLLMVNTFHHQIANLWHAAVHIIHHEDHHHHHAELSNKSAESVYIGDVERHNHQTIKQFVNQFKIDASFANESNQTVTQQNQNKLCNEVDLVLNKKEWLQTRNFKPFISLYSYLSVQQLSQPPQA